MWEEYVEACFKILSRHLHLEIEGEKSLIRDILPDISPSPTHTLDSALCFRSSCQLLYPSSLSSYHRGKIEIPLCGRRHLNCVFLPSPLPGGRTETSIVKDHTLRQGPEQLAEIETRYVRIKNQEFQPRHSAFSYHYFCVIYAVCSSNS